MRFDLSGAVRGLGVIALLAGLGACGGGGGSSLTTNTYTPGVYPASSTYKDKCAQPRGTGFPDKAGSITLENSWLRSWTNELYLWYSEVPDLDPSKYTTTDAYFKLLKTSAVTSSGNAKDKFHFTYPTSVWQSLSQSGVQAGYGAEFLVVAGTPPRRIVIAFVEPASSTPAQTATLSRGEEIVTVDGVDAVNAGTQAAVDTLNAGIFPDVAGSQHTFGVRELNGTTRNVTMTSANVTSTPVQNVKIIPQGSTNVGYILFNDHIATSEAMLINAFNQLQGVNDLVLDIRYNGGGYLTIANEIAYMIAGSQNTSGKTFEKLQFNDKNPTADPVTKQTITPMPFLTVSQGFSGTANQPLPSLNLGRVFVITGKNTCSASESIINSLNGAGVQVIQIGSTTCGKPYGFYPQDNCGTTYFSIEFRGLNNVGYGDYTDGFQPANGTVAGSKTLPGCGVADDFTLALGDPNEKRLAATLGYRLSSTCPTPATGFAKPSAEQALLEADGDMPKNPFRENRIITPYKL
jgi:hypothetical protein